MTLVRFQNRPNGFAAFNNLIGDVLPQMPSLYKGDLRLAVPVNIRETEKEYVLELAAPGMNKEDFSVNLENNLLTVSGEKKEEKTAEGEKLIRKEFKAQSFKRSFTLDDKINEEGITAQYVNGVLTLTLPKKEEVKPATKNISIQ